MRSRALLLTTTLSGALLAICGCSRPASAPPAPASAAAALDVKDLKPGSGEAITPGHEAVVQYTGWLYDESAPDHKGREFDSSGRTGRPFTFMLGAGQVIKGWDQGVAGMRVGGERRLIVPASLAYGDEGAGGVIPPGATLVFDVELVGIR